MMVVSTFGLLSLTTDTMNVPQIVQGLSGNKVFPVGSPNILPYGPLILVLGVSAIIHRQFVSMLSQCNSLQFPGEQFQVWLSARKRFKGLETIGHCF